jgi:hypothetical protein
MKHDAYRATLLGDVMASRTATDRRELHRQFALALRRLQEALPADDDPVIVSGDEFQAVYATVGAALHAAFTLRLDLLPEIDMRFGIGWGEITVPDRDRGTQDGPGWWSARDAIDSTKRAQSSVATRHLHTTYLPHESTGAHSEAVNAALLCRDHLMGCMDPRSLRILGGLVAGRTKAELAAEEGISRSAVSQRSGRDGIDVVLAASDRLREVQ